MKKSFHIFLFSLLIASLFAQGQIEIVAPRACFPEPPVPEIYTLVETNAEFPGGIEAMKKYIADNITYPNNRIKTEQTGKCYIKFVVNKNGSLSNIEVLKGVPGCPECDKEAVRVIKTMPAWEPGKIGGKPVDQYYNLPVSFNIPAPIPLSAEELSKAKAEAEAKALAEARAKAEAERIAKLIAVAEAKAKEEARAKAEAEAERRNSVTEEKKIERK